MNSENPRGPVRWMRSMSWRANPGVAALGSSEYEDGSSAPVRVPEGC